MMEKWHCRKWSATSPICDVSRPVLTVALLRLIFQTAPPLNYALPMTAVRWRDHLVGSVLGLPVPVVVMAFFFDRLLHSRA